MLIYQYQNKSLGLREATRIHQQLSKEFVVLAITESFLGGIHLSTLQWFSNGTSTLGIYRILGTMGIATSKLPMSEKGKWTISMAIFNS